MLLLPKFNTKPTPIRFATIALNQLHRSLTKNLASLTANECRDSTTEVPLNLRTQEVEVFWGLWWAGSLERLGESKGVDQVLRKVNWLRWSMKYLEKAY
jgi:hypothetical protein